MNEKLPNPEGLYPGWKPKPPRDRRTGVSFLLLPHIPKLCHVPPKLTGSSVGSCPLPFLPAVSTMPSLTLDTSPKTEQPGVKSRSTSPNRPPVSPITPTLANARLLSDNVRQTLTHSTQQTPQVILTRPPLEPIDFEDNPDVLALRSTISILQMQGQKATSDMQKLKRNKERALRDPEGFVRALAAGEIKTEADPLFNPSASSDDEDEGMSEGKKDSMAWETLPTPQNVVRMPVINWSQYAVVGESLDKIHADQLSRPVEGAPQRIGPDGQLISGGEGSRRQADLGVAAPYQPGKDKIEKMSTRKGGKR